MPNNRYQETLDKLIYTSQIILDKAFEKTEEVYFQRLLEYIESNIISYKRDKGLILPSRKEALYAMRDFINMIRKDFSSGLTYQDKTKVVIGFLLEEQAKFTIAKKGGLSGALLKDTSFSKFYNDMVKTILDNNQDPTEYREAFRRHQQEHVQNLKVEM